MKFRLIVRELTIRDDRTEWTETYDKPVGPITANWTAYHPDNPLRGRNQKAVEEWGRALIAWFNSGLRPGEGRRTFVSVEIIKEGGGEQ